MKVFALNTATQNNIEKCTGISFKKVVSDNMGSNSAMFSKKRDPRKVGRGNPLLARKRIRTLDDVEKKLERIH